MTSLIIASIIFAATYVTVGAISHVLYLHGQKTAKLASSRTCEVAQAPEAPCPSPSLPECPLAPMPMPMPAPVPMPLDDKETLGLKLMLDQPMIEQEVQTLARLEMLRGWQFYKKPETLKRKLYPALSK